MSESEKALSENPTTEEDFATHLMGSSDATPFSLEDGGLLEEDSSKPDDEEIGSIDKPPACDPDSHLSSQEDLPKDDIPESEESDPDLDLLSLQEKQCLSHLKGIQEVPPEIIDEVDTIFKQYRKSASEKKLRKHESDEKMWWKLEDEISEEGGYGKEEKNPEKMKKDQKHLSVEDDSIQNEEFKELQKENEKLADEREVLLQRINDLEKEVDKNQIGDDAEAKEKTVASYIKEIGKLKKELDIFEEKVLQCQAEKKALEVQLEDKEKEFAELEETVKKCKDDAMKHETMRKKVEADIEKANQVMDQLRSSFSKSNEKFLKSVQELTMKDEENEELKKALRGFNNQQKCMSNYIVELRDRLEFLSKSYIQVEEQNAKLKSLCSQQTDTLKDIKNKSAQLGNFQEIWVNRLEALNRKYRSAGERIRKLNDEMSLKLKEINHLEQDKIVLNKKMNELKKEKEEAFEKAHNLTEKLNEKERQFDSQYKAYNKLNIDYSNLNKLLQKQQQEISELNNQNKRSQKTVKKMEDENEYMTAALQSTVQHLLNAEKELKKKEKEVRDMVADYNNILLEKKTLRARLLQTYGQSRSNEFQIRYLDSVIAYDKHKLDRSDDMIKTLQYKVQKLQYDYNCLKIAFKERKLEIRKLIEDINYKEREKGNLDKLIQKGEIIRINVIRDAERLRQDVSILKTVIQRRNAEISLVYEKSELMSAILNDGENKMKQRLTDIHLLKTEVLKLRAENKMLIKAVQNNANLKKEINSLQKDLSQAKQKCSVLEEQMENPINIHRWRILKGNDPEKSKLIEENHSLKKKLFETENKHIELKEKMYILEVTHNNLKEKIIKREEERDAVMKLHDAQRTIRSKNSEIQRLSVTLRSYQFNTKELHKEMEKTKVKADDCMKKYYDLKRKYDKEHLNKTDDELMSSLPFKTTCFSQSKEDLVKRILHKPPSSRTFSGTGLTIPKSNR